MFNKAIKLFKARKDRSLASQIAGEFAVDSAVEYASWPIRITKFWMAVALVALTLFTLLFLWLGSLSHWSVAIPTLLSSGLIYGIIRIWRGINAGIEKVTQVAKAEIDKRIEIMKASSIPPSNL